MRCCIRRLLLIALLAIPAGNIAFGQVDESRKGKSKKDKGETACRLKLKVSAQSPTCPNTPDGAIEIIPLNGKSPFAYEWSNGEHINRVEQVEAGEYNVVVTDRRGCSATETILLETSGALDIVSQILPPGCYGDELGSISLKMKGGSPPYTFKWAHGPNTNKLEHLNVGKYSVSVTDRRGCQTEGTYSLEQPPQLSINESRVKPVSSPEARDGAVEVFVSGGRSPYSFHWKHNASALPFVSGLGNGQYTVMIADAGNCQQTFVFDLRFREQKKEVLLSSSYTGNGVPVEAAEIRLDNINWAYGSRDLDEAARASLNALAQILRKYPSMSIEVHAHTDSRSSAGFNLDLSKKRANAVTTYLSRQGIRSERLVAIGHGERQLLNECADGVPCSDRQHRENRRTTFTISSISEDQVPLDLNGQPDLLALKAKVSEEMTGMIVEQVETDLDPNQGSRRYVLTNLAGSSSSNSSGSSSSSASKTDKPQVEEESTGVWWESGNSFGVYLCTVEELQKKESKDLWKLGPMQYEQQQDGSSIVILGYFTDPKQAEATLAKAKSAGFSGCSLRSYIDGKPSR